MIDTIPVALPQYPHFITMLFLCWIAGVMIGYAAAWMRCFRRRRKNG